MFPRLLPLLILLANKLIGKSIDIVIAFDVRKTNIVVDAMERIACPAACPR
jgi:adenylate kinase family enzyme